MKSFICAHCNHSFKEERALTRHQETSKKCLEIQTDEMIDDLEKAKTKIGKMKKQIKEYKDIIDAKDGELARLRSLLMIKNDIQQTNVYNERKTLLEMLQNGEFSNLSISDKPVVNRTVKIN